jgi:hypothetical protein
MMPFRVQVESKNIDSVLYNPEDQTLEVRFAKGGEYRYAGVDQDIYNTFLESPSKGAYLHKVIKQACPCEKIEKKKELGLPVPPGA